MNEQKVNLNTATAKELVQLPGIGPTLAVRIITYRETVHPFEEPIEIKSKGEVIEMIENFEIRYPTLADCMKAEARLGHSDTIRTQFNIYAEAIEKVNGQEADAKWKNRYGMLLFENMRNFRTDFKKIDSSMSKYGMKMQIEKQCPKCGKQWEAEVNTSSFFESALRSM